MKTVNMIISILLLLIFLGLISSIIQKQGFMGHEQPHFYRRLGLAPPYCPFRQQYY